MRGSAVSLCRGSLATKGGGEEQRNAVLWIFSKLTSLSTLGTVVFFSKNVVIVYCIFQYVLTDHFSIPK